tara:strand:+ start:145 stop:351 length:207 start_codon:yes stop_codon:yes gene_type:complete
VLKKHFTAEKPAFLRIFRNHFFLSFVPTFHDWFPLFLKKIMETNREMSAQMIKKNSFEKDAKTRIFPP